MRTSLTPAEIGFVAADRKVLSKAVAQACDARHLRRFQAVLFVAEGYSFAEAARLAGLSLRSVYRLVTCYVEAHRLDALDEGHHTGRPPTAPEVTRQLVLQELRRLPLTLGYRSNVWTVALLASHLCAKKGCTIEPWTLRRRMKEMGLRCKRPRYVYSQKEPHRTQKKGRLFGV